MIRVNVKCGAALISSLAMLSVVLLYSGGCTSDPASTVGFGLIDNGIDETLVSLEISAVVAFSGIRVNNKDVEIYEQEVLYVGEEIDTKTMFMANFDFSEAISPEIPLEAWTVDNIQSVNLLLKKFAVYATEEEDEEEEAGAVLAAGDQRAGAFPDSLIFFLNELEAPFLEEDYLDYPAVVPPFDPTLINQDFNEPNGDNEPRILMFDTDVIRWATAGEEVGVLIRTGPATAPGLVGFASEDLTKFSELTGALQVGAAIGPTIAINFASPDTIILLRPVADTTIYEAVAPVSETIAEASDGFLLRTGLRSYPAIRFDLAQVPENALINRAVLSVTNDTSSSYGPEFSVMISEIVAEVMDDPSLTLEAFDLGDSTKVYPLTYRSNLRAKEDYVIEFDITTGIRRAVNRVNEEPRGFLLSAIEDPTIFPFGLRPPDVTGPDFYYRQLNFLGFTDPDPELRPVLKIWYSIVDELSGGGK